MAEGRAHVDAVLTDDLLSLAGRHAVVLGLARQGIALARYLHEQGAKVTVSDLATEEHLAEEITQLDSIPVELVLGGHPLSLLDNCDNLFLSGGIPPQIPFVQEAVRRAIPLANDSLLTFALAKTSLLGPTIGITGSSGKTTTTTLVGLMLQESGLDPQVGGNIGQPLIGHIRDVHKDQPIVMEMSSFQLELFDPRYTRVPVDQIGPDFAAITNITPNHLDRHPSMAAYVDAKFNLIRTLRHGSTLVLNLDDPITSALFSENEDAPQHPLLQEWGLDDLLSQLRCEIESRDLRLLPFSLSQPLATGACVVDDELMLNRQTICERSALQMRGEHNVSNMLAAAAISHAAGASIDAIRSVATSFCGVLHRLEIVAVRDGVTWINDSIATAPERTVAALRSIDDAEQTIILLAGGKDKNLPWDEFATEAIKRVRFLIGFGNSGDMIVNHVKEKARFNQLRPPECATVHRLDEAVEIAARIAEPQSVVLLSPGGTSFDAYKDFEERGEHFRKLVDHAMRFGVKSAKQANDDLARNG